MPHQSDTPHRPPLIDALLKAGPYDHPTRDITLVETHISWVILTGPFAYKLKKPVRFDFLDYSTPDLRKFYCQEEFRLNRRFAPNLYLAVVPITGTPHSPSLGGPGTPLEFAVKMRQFPQDALLSHLVDLGRLLPKHIDRLAAEIASFHAKADTAPPGSTFGTPRAILDPARDNFKTLLAADLPEIHAPAIRRLSEWTEAEAARLADTFLARLKNGAVRECHGDLHLRNLLLENDGSVTLFDGIEFNEGFRWIDVINEVAFCTMDLQDRRRPDLAHRLLNAYLEAAGDYPGLAVARFYTAYRALVRAKVAALRLLQERQNGAAPDPDLPGEIATYLHLAERSTRPENPPALLVTCGVSGSGKTTMTRPLVDLLGFIRIRSDVERKRLFDLAPQARSGSPTGAGIYSDEATEKTYRRCADHAEAALRAGFPALVDATFLRQNQRLMFADLAARLHVPFRILHFDLPTPELRRRVRERQAHGRDASEATLDVLEVQLTKIQPPAQDELAHTIRIGSPESDLPALLKASLGTT